MPGEKKAIFYEKTFVEREAIDNKNLEKYVDEIYRGEADLQTAIKKTYHEASKLSKRSDSVVNNATFGKVKSLLVQTAQDQN